MALRKTVDFKNMVVPSAYIRVGPVTILPGNTRMELTVNIMVNAESEPFDIYTESAPYNLEGGNPIRQSYDFLKTLERFQGAEDC
jgi:hypothetical protein